MIIKYRFLTKTILRYIPSLTFLFYTFILNGQNIQYNYFYRIYFNDKGDNKTVNFTASGLLSERAVKRREKSGINTPDIRDIPVFSGYIDQIKSLGLTLHCTSKWLNTGLFKTTVPVNTDLLLSLPFVKDIKTVKYPADKSIYFDKLDFQTNQSDFPLYDQLITMINGQTLHNSGFDGKGILIAVLDGGFNNADVIPALEMLYKRKGVKATYDFVLNKKHVYDYHTHGTAVLSILAGQIEGIIKGSAPGADFMLFRTEDTSYEFPVEEDFWVAAAEFADSSGADIISSSLGYAYFDDPLLDYKFTDMDGNSAFITRAADIAASKGILVFSSAGNERDKKWTRILAPSDGDSVMCVGAVDYLGNISVFSSAGPSADGRVKPDNTTMGVNVTIQISPGSVTRSSGTSFSCPVLSGISACLMQAVPAASNTDIIDALHQSAHKFNSPDSLYGYGIPEMTISLKKLQDAFLKIPDKGTTIFPNPTTGEIEITFREPPEWIKIEIYTSSGNIIFRENIDQFEGRYIRITALKNTGNGIYFIRLRTGTGVYLHKIIKSNI